MILNDDHIRIIKIYTVKDERYFIFNHLIFNESNGCKILLLHVPTWSTRHTLNLDQNHYINAFVSNQIFLVSTCISGDWRRLSNQEPFWLSPLTFEVMPSNNLRQTWPNTLFLECVLQSSLLTVTFSANNPFQMTKAETYMSLKN